MPAIPYTAKRLENGRAAYVPEVPAQIVLHDGHITPAMPVLLDTGADGTHLPVQLAEPFGVDLEQCEKLTMVYAGGEVPVYRPPGAWNAIVAGYLVPITPVFGDDYGSPVLGRDVLQSFRATFDGRARRVELEPFKDVQHVGQIGRVWTDVPEFRAA
jgi:hypothetical protein